MWIEPILLTEIFKEIADRVGSQVSVEKTEHKYKTST